MGDSSHSDTQGPYRLVRNKDGTKSYYAGHHENGQVRWLAEKNDREVIHYPDPGVAAAVQRALPTEFGVTLNVVRIT